MSRVCRMICSSKRMLSIRQVLFSAISACAACIEVYDIGVCVSIRQVPLSFSWFHHRCLCVYLFLSFASASSCLHMSLFLFACCFELSVACDYKLIRDAICPPLSCSRPRWQASKTGMIMELNHPGWQDSVENAASVAVDAAIRAETYNGGDALMMVERAAVEGATKAAKEMEIKAESSGSQGPAEQAVAQRVENSAVRAAIMAANEVQSEHNHASVLMRPAMVMPSQMTISSATPGAAQGVAAAMSGAYGYQMPMQAAVAAAAPAAAVTAPAAAVAMGGAPMLAGGVPGGVAFGGGSSFIPDTVQGVPGMVEGTMYVPE